MALKRVPLDSHDPESYHGIHHNGVCPVFFGLWRSSYENIPRICAPFRRRFFFLRHG